MNLLILLAGARAWTGAPLEVLSRVLAAIAVLSVEMQAVTWLRAGNLRTLVIVNAALAVVALVGWPSRRDPPGRPPSRVSDLPWPLILLLGALVLTLNLTSPLEAADPYHLDRVAQIERLGTLEYDLRAESRVNVLGWVYELVLADLRQVPVAGPVIVRLHGVAALLFYALAVAGIRQWLTGGSRWCWTAMFAVPVVFHQLVLIKNDLFGAVPALVALTWAVMRAKDASCREIMWASSLVGFAAAVKLTSFPLALVTLGTILIDRRGAWRPVGCALLGCAIGLAVGGLPFSLAQNQRWYGAPFEPVAALGNRHVGVIEASIGLVRFGISLFDFGVLTRNWWPARGGWGSTFGAPLVWAIVVLVARSAGPPAVRRALMAAAVYFLAFAAVYPDADLAHRLVLAPGLMLIAVAVHHLDGDVPSSVWFRRTLAFVLIISAAQIARSALLYLAAS